MKRSLTKLTKGEINEFVAVPSLDKIPIGGGRHLLIRSWEPRVHWEEAISVKIEAIIEGPYGMEVGIYSRDEDPD